MGAIQEIVFDCDNPPVLAQFWAELLEGYEVRAADETETALVAALGLPMDIDSTVMVDGPGPSICFQTVDEGRPENNRVHFDITVTDRPAETERLREVGATVERVLPTYTVMRDPEGNQFCLVDGRVALAQDRAA